MLNKLQFNNLIITNKKKIKQARVQTINKFVQKLRKQQQLLNKQPENVKIKERLRKINECIELLKKCKPADIVRQTLVLQKKPIAIISNEHATPKEITIAMLAMNKINQDLLKKFKEVLQLDENDNSWKSLIMEKSKRREKIERTEMKKRKRMQIKQEKAGDRKRKEWLAKNTNGSTAAGEETANIEVQLKTLGPWKVEELIENSVNEIGSEEDVDEIEKPKQDKKQIKNIKQNTNQPAAESIKKSKENSKKLEKQKKIQEKVNEKSIGEQANEPSLSLDNTVATQKTNAFKSKERKKDVYQEEVKEVQKVVDPFFITDSGENYVATVFVQPESEEPDEYDNTSSYQPPSGMNRRQYREYQRNNLNKSTSDYRDKELSHSRPQQADQNMHPSWLAKQKQKPIILNNMPNKKIKFNADGDSAETTTIPSPMKKTLFTNDTKPDADLHPSWLAKQKQKPIILNNMPNKKIKFDAEGGSGNGVAVSAMRNPKEKTISPNDTKPAADLHPSWLAKQKQKPIILNNMPNKKIKFNTDGDNGISATIPSSKEKKPFTNDAKTDPDLHPSWAAKQKLKPTIQAFQGKKIKF